MRVGALTTVQSDVLTLPRDGFRLHTVRLVYDVEIVGGTLQPEQTGTTDEARWCSPADIAALPLMSYVPAALAGPAGTAGLHHACGPG